MRLVFDLEGNGLLVRTPEAGPVDRIHCIVAKDIDTREVFKFRPEDCPSGAKLLMNAALLIGHNIIGYDLLALAKVYPWFTFDMTKVVDTLVLSRLLYPDMM